MEEKWRTKSFSNLFIDAVKHTYQLRIPMYSFPIKIIRT